MYQELQGKNPFKYALNFLKKIVVVTPTKLVFGTNLTHPFAWGLSLRANEDDIRGGVVRKVFEIVGRVLWNMF